MSNNANGTEDDDQLFLDQVLSKLYDFGDKPASNKKSQKRKRKRCEEEEKEEEPVAAEDVGSDTNNSSTECLGARLTQENAKTHHSNDERIGPTIQQRAQVEVVTFQDPTKRPKTNQTPAPDTQKPPQIKDQKKNEDSEKFSLEKARLEVHRFGITGYQKEQQRVFEQERAIMLGARPPRKEYVNYKVLQEQIKEKKEKAKEEVQLDQKKKKKSKKQDKTRNEKRKSSSGSGSAPSGPVGRFKNGVLLLRPNEIQKIKGSRGSR